MRIRSGYSFHVAAGHLPDVIDRIKEIGWKEAPLADRSSTFGFTEHDKLARKAGLRPIFGVEIGVVESLGEKKPRFDPWTFFATERLRDLHALIAKATEGTGKEPSLLYRHALEWEGVVKIAGENLLIGNVAPQPDFFVALSPGLPRATYKAAKEKGLSFIASSHVFYPKKEDNELYRILMGPIRADNRSYPQHIMSDDEWRSSVALLASPEDVASALENRDRVMRLCRAELKKANMLVHPKPKSLRRLCEEGAAELGIELKGEYLERLERELSVIKEKNFEDYFHILADVMTYARGVMVCGPARGSSAGSLVAYLLSITSIDPIKFDLLFERFIDVTREDPPDVDIDFSDARRHLAFEYMEKKFGEDRVARLGSVSQFKPASALNSVGVSLKIPSWDIDKVAEGAIKRAMGDSRSSSTIEDTMKETEAGMKMLKEHPEIMIVARMENHPSNAGQHAAGMILTDEPIIEYVAVNSKTKSAMCDKKDAEELNLLKIDALGLTQLSIFERTMDLIGVKSVSGWLEKIPLDDPAAFQILNDGKFSGVFQFIGSASQGITKQIHVDKFEDLSSVTALARPGPLASGGTDKWVKRRNGNEEITYPDPLFKPYLESTLGIPIYQEQVLRIGRELGELSWTDVIKMRQGMSRSMGVEYFNQFGDRWKAAVIKKGVPSDVASKTWDDLCQFGAWAFNKSHSVAYAMVAYWCCWFKAHHPIEFAAATLDMEANPDKQITLLRELKAEGIDYMPVDVEKSTDKWESVEIGENKQKVLVGPLTNIEGIGPAGVLRILDSRKRDVPLTGAIEKKLRAPKTKIDTLTPVSDYVKRKDLVKMNIVSTPRSIETVQPGVREVMVIAILDKIVPTDDNAPVKIARRNGRKIIGPSTSLNLFVHDDTDTIFCKVPRWKYEEMGRPIFERGGAGKAVYAIKGNCPDDFRMIWVENVRFIGLIDEKEEEAAA